MVEDKHRGRGQPQHPPQGDHLDYISTGNKNNYFYLHVKDSMLKQSTDEERTGMLPGAVD